MQGSGYGFGCTEIREVDCTEVEVQGCTLVVFQNLGTSGCTVTVGHWLDYIDVVFGVD